jgi:hypothetical protein
MQNGRIGARMASLRELLAHMIDLYEAAHGGNACRHEAEYYAQKSRWRAYAWNSPLYGIAMTGVS